jgi:HSP20 family protein
MTKDSDERRMRSGAGRVRGLQDIRTLGALRKPVPGLLRQPLADVRTTQGPAQREPRAPAEQSGPPEQPRTWVFIKRPKSPRHQGMLLVDRMAEPTVDIFEKGHSLVVFAELPGARKEDVDVRVNGDVLVLSTTAGNDERPRYYREMLLPFPVNSERIQQTFRSGVLELELERACASSPETEPKKP